MPAVTTYTKALTESQAARLRTVLQAKGFKFLEKPYCLYAAEGTKVNVAVYEKGPKIVAQGKGVEEFITFTLEPEVLGVAELGYEEVNQPEMFEPHLGIDESGKGDFFGPLVIAGAYVEASMARKLRDMGVMDSKRIGSDARIEAIAGDMRAARVVHEVIVIGPEKYNELYTKFGNLNRLLAWGHARVIENLLERVPDCPMALSDQFANPRVLQSALLEKGKTIDLQQRTKAESDPAVAAASIFAREKFVRWLKEAGDRLGILLPKGASPAVKQAGAELIRKHGADILPKVAKMHFKTAIEVAAIA
ncbi:ribonuclease HIII [Verrucomicrobium spinosum]|uniref:ribonuclease HIII n=1 Tax=Verrucomicrobium spinosum TaxID=2736 RepID=UPI0001746832|nr:ribonuclease HIII [Verrucomicrobium spinosum]